MQKVDLQLWYDYRLGHIHRTLTAQEFNEIRACEFAMHFLIPEKALLEKCGGFENLANLLSVDDYEAVCRLARALANEFVVDEKMMFIRLQELNQMYIEQQKQKKEKKNDAQNRILKKTGNVIFVQFDK